MRLLVSVVGVQEVSAVLDGGADIVDVKEPSSGPLGAPELATFRAVRAAVLPPRLTSIAIGDVSEDPPILLARARSAASSGADFVKIGLHHTGRAVERVLDRVARVVAEVGPATRVVGVGYADHLKETVLALPELARTAGAHGVMLDTGRKDGKSLLDHMQEVSISRFVDLGHGAGLVVGLAGSLGLAELERVRDSGADVVGVRGAACCGGRLGRVSAERVRRLAQAIRRQPLATGTRISYSRPAAATGK